MVAMRSEPLAVDEARREFLEHQPTYWLKRCYQALRRDVDQALRAYELTLSQRDVLLALRSEGSLDQGTLRYRLGLEQSSVSRLVDGLARRGLVELRAGRSDRRVRIATLTPEGEDLLGRTPGSSRLAGGVMVSGLSQAEQHELIRLLRHCALNLDRDEGEEAE